MDRPPPWTVSYADGSANRYRIAHASPDADVEIEYVPVTPAHSSTGQYSGGEPWQLHLAADDPRVDELWRRVEAFEADTAHHIEARIKGSGAFTVTIAGATRELLVGGGAALRELDAFLAAVGPRE